jgi:hypothetical protein
MDYFMHFLHISLYCNEIIVVLREVYAHAQVTASTNSVSEWIYH